MRVVEQSAQLLTPYSEKEVLLLLEQAGRVCYKSEHKIHDNSAKTFVSNIIKNHHQSVLEHVSLTFRLITDRGVSHELVRHRLASYSQESTRYIRYSNIEFIKPVGLYGYEQETYWKQAMLMSEAMYYAMLKDGITPEIARSVLPNSTKTELVMTANIREWQHILKMRTSVAAHPQMKDLMRLVEQILCFNYPTLFKEARDD